MIPGRLPALRVIHRQKPHQLSAPSAVILQCPASSSAHPSLPELPRSGAIQFDRQGRQGRERCPLPGPLGAPWRYLASFAVDRTSPARRGADDSGAQLRQPPLEEPPFRVVPRQRQRVLVRRPGLVRAAQPPQQVGADGGQHVVAGERRRGRPARRPAAARRPARRPWPGRRRGSARSPARAPGASAPRRGRRSAASRWPRRPAPLGVQRGDRGLHRVGRRRRGRPSAPARPAPGPRRSSARSQSRGPGPRAARCRPRRRSGPAAAPRAAASAPAGPAPRRGRAAARPAAAPGRSPRRPGCWRGSPA